MIGDVPNNLPLPIRELVKANDVPLFPCRPVASTDESVRRRRQSLGANVFPVSVLLDHSGRFVIVRYAKQPRPGGWTIPGGYAEPGEPLQAGAIREAREECGLGVELGVAIGVVTTKVTSPSAGDLGYYLTIFRGRSSGGHLAPEDREEIDDVRLVTIDAIEALVVADHFPSVHPNLNPAIIECLRQALRR